MGLVVVENVKAYYLETGFARNENNVARKMANKAYVLEGFGFIGGKFRVHLPHFV